MANLFPAIYIYSTASLLVSRFKSPTWTKHLLLCFYVKKIPNGTPVIHNIPTLGWSHLSCIMEDYSCSNYFFLLLGEHGFEHVFLNMLKGNPLPHLLLRHKSREAMNDLSYTPLVFMAMPFFRMQSVASA